MSTIDEHATHTSTPGPHGGDPRALSPNGETQAPTGNTRRSEQLQQGSALLWEVAQTVLLTIAIFLSVRLVVQNFRVEGASMDPTLHSGQFLLANKIAYARADGTPLEQFVPPTTARGGVHYIFGGPQRGDIIVFRSPGSADKDLIKRVIGLPGETVTVEDGDVFINGVKLSEPYIVHHARYDLENLRVPSDAYFVLGDNRPNSLDSHSGRWTVPAESIIGRAWVSYWPPSLWGFISTASYPELGGR